MSDYDSLLQSIGALGSQMREFQATAAAQYLPLVDALIAGGCQDARLIEQTLDGLLDFCGNKAALELYRRLCRHYYTIDPVATVAYINAYREWWDSDEAEH